MEKKINLELLRILACFLVIVNHTNSRIFLSIEISKTWFASLAYFFVCKIAVPIFIMISGAVLLGKSESYQDIFRKRILKILLVIIIFSILYYVNQSVLTGNEFSLNDFFYRIYVGSITNAFWYLYMYLGLMVMLPIIRKMTKEFTTKDYFYCTAIFLIYFGTMPILCKYFKFENFNGNFMPTIFGGFVIYFILGDFIQNKLEKQYLNRKYAIVSIILFIMCTAISTLVTFTHYNDSKELFMDNISFATIVIPSVSIFYLFKYLISFISISMNIKKITIILGRCTFGIYLLSDLLIEKLDFIYNWGINNYLQPLISIVILEMTVFIIGFVITLLLKRVPLLKKII